MPKPKPADYKYDPAWSTKERHAHRCTSYRRANRAALRKRREQREIKFITRLCVLGRTKVLTIMGHKTTPVRQMLRRVQGALEAEGVKQSSVRFMRILELRLLAEQLSVEKRKLALKEKGTTDATEKQS